MPFRIIRDDITRVRADAIVDSANPHPRIGGGTDAAVYRAAGTRRLLAARRTIGDIAPGQAAVTPAFRLPAKFVIHTVGPVWVDGAHGELATLRACYLNSLALADELGCRSVAFPLISTGTYGFPKDQALDVALAAIRDHLEISDLAVTLVVFGQDSFQLAADLVAQVDQYIDEHYCAEQTEREYGGAGSGTLFEQLAAARRHADRLWDMREADEQSTDAQWADAQKKNPFAPDFSYDEMEFGAPEPLAAPSRTTFGAPEPLAAPAPMPTRATSAAPAPPLDDALSGMGDSFQTELFRLIDARGLTDPQVYKRANLDRKLFSKIRCNPAYLPKKRTILALAIALELDVAQTRALLASAGYTLTNSIRQDVIVSFCLEHGLYDIYEVDTLLSHYGEPELP